jgi:predicted lipoprotein with Yx(FWY)xxD motif
VRPINQLGEDSMKKYATAFQFAMTSVAAMALVGCAAMPSAQMPAKASNGMLTDASGMTLYTFDRDAAGSGKSACVDKCAGNWPALHAQASDQPHGDYGIIQRDDGTRQWTFRGKPLYRWLKDQKPGDKTGDGVNNVWHAATP